MEYFWPLIISLILAFILTPGWRWVAQRRGVVDKPSVDVNGRKKHDRPVAYLGGLAIGLTAICSILIFSQIDQRHIIFLLGLVLIILLGLIDDILSIKPWQKLLGQIFVGLFLVAGGIGIKDINVPLVGLVDLQSWVVNLAGLEIAVWSGVFTVVWVLFVVNALNFLDGVDGLASGVSLIGFLVIFSLGLAPYVNQPTVALLAMIMIGAVVGFWPYNLPKATIFLGDSGSLLLGYVLAVLAIFSGGKVATTGLVLGIVILDTIAVIVGRWWRGGKIWRADRSHLHFKLLDRGWTAWQVLGLYLFVSLILGVLALFVPSGVGKLIIGLVAVLYFAGLLIYLYFRQR